MRLDKRNWDNIFHYCHWRRRRLHCRRSSPIVVDVLLGHTCAREIDARSSVKHLDRWANTQHPAQRWNVMYVFIASWLWCRCEFESLSFPESRHTHTHTHSKKESFQPNLNWSFWLYFRHETYKVASVLFDLLSGARQCATHAYADRSHTLASSHAKRKQINDNWPARRRRRNWSTNVNSLANSIGKGNWRLFISRPEAHFIRLCDDGR